MSGVQPYREIQNIARTLRDLQTHAELTDALDRVVYLFGVIPPELQEPVEQLMAQLRRKLAQAGS
jgi:hypothetical protein